MSAKANLRTNKNRAPARGRKKPNQTMKGKTTYTVAISIAKMEALVAKMKENMKQDDTLLPVAIFHLAIDTDLNTMIIDAEREGKQLCAYSECNPKIINQ